LPAASVAHTAKVWSPSVNGGATTGELHGQPDGWSSRRQVKVDPGSEALNANVGVGLSVTEGGPDVIVVSGGVLSST
jgi:hypothetical protein